MKRLYLLVLKSYIGPLVLTFFIALFILVMQFLWKYIDDLVGKGLEWHVVAQLLFYASTTFVPLALPLSILLSSLMTFGNLGERYELVAMKSAGISLSHIMRPLIVLSILISIGAFFFSNNVLPISNLKFKSILYDVRQQKLALNIREGIFYSDIDGYVLRIGKKESDGVTVRDIIIYDHTGHSGNNNVTRAEWGKMEQSKDGSTLELTLFNGYNYNEKISRKNDPGRPFQRTYFAEQYRIFDLSDFKMIRTNEALFRNHYAMLNLKQLQLSTDSLKNELDTKIENYNKATLSNYSFMQESDSVITPDTSGVYDRLYALNGMSKKDKLEVLERALNMARNSRNQAEFEKNDHNERMVLIRKHEVEWHLKFTLSFACMVLFFIGAPFGAIIRKGGLGLPLVISVIFFVIYHVLSITGKKAVIAGTLDPVSGMWLSSIVLLPVGIWFTIKANKDSPLLDTDVWRNKLNLIFHKSNKQSS
ncbi:MAG TPA: LptF/LptG family permease [Lentimicrobium sp.]|nr:LptF/LptG family permease [Lentimicrobium sp.]